MKMFLNYLLFLFIAWFKVCRSALTGQLELAVHLSHLKCIECRYPTKYRVAVTVSTRCGDKLVPAKAYHYNGGEETKNLNYFAGDFEYEHIWKGHNLYMTKVFTLDKEGKSANIDRVAHFKLDLPALPSYMDDLSLFVEFKLLPLGDAFGTILIPKQVTYSEKRFESVVVRVANVAKGVSEYTQVVFDKGDMHFKLDAVVHAYFVGFDSKELKYGTVEERENYDYWDRMLKSCKNKNVYKWFNGYPFGDNEANGSSTTLPQDTTESTDLSSVWPSHFSDFDDSRESTVEGNVESNVDPAVSTETPESTQEEVTENLYLTSSVWPSHFNDSYNESEEQSTDDSVTKPEDKPTELQDTTESALTEQVGESTTDEPTEDPPESHATDDTVTNEEEPKLPYSENGRPVEWSSVDPHDEPTELPQDTTESALTEQDEQSSEEADGSDPEDDEDEEDEMPTLFSESTPDFVDHLLKDVLDKQDKTAPLSKSTVETLAGLRLAYLLYAKVLAGSCYKLGNMLVGGAVHVNLSEPAQLLADGQEGNVSTSNCEHFDTTCSSTETKPWTPYGDNPASLFSKPGVVEVTASASLVSFEDGTKVTFAMNGLNDELRKLLEDVAEELDVKSLPGNYLSVPVTSGVRFKVRDLLVDVDHERAVSGALGRFRLHLKNLQTFLESLFKEFLEGQRTVNAFDLYGKDYWYNKSLFFKQLVSQTNSDQVLSLIKPLNLTDEHHFLVLDTSPSFLDSPELLKVDPSAHHVAKDHSDHLVVLLHGYGPNTVTTRGVKNNFLTMFQGALWEVILAEKDDYNKSVADLGEFVATKVKERLASPECVNVKKVSFVAHSFGGLLVRAAVKYLGDEHVSKLHALVTIGTNHLGYPTTSLFDPSTCVPDKDEECLKWELVDVVGDKLNVSSIDETLFDVETFEDPVTYKKYSPKSGTNVSSVLHRGSPVWKASNYKENLLGVWVHYDKDKPVAVAVNYVKADGKSVWKHSSNLRAVPASEACLGPSNGTLADKPKPHGATLTLYKLDDANVDVSKVDLENGLELMEHSPHDGHRVTKVLDGGELLWEAKNDKERCLFAHSYSKENFHLLFLNTGSNTEFKYFEKRGGLGWVQVPENEFDEKLKKVDGSYNPPTEDVGESSGSLELTTSAPSDSKPSLKGTGEQHSTFFLQFSRHAGLSKFKKVVLVGVEDENGYPYSVLVNAKNKKPEDSAACEVEKNLLEGVNEEDLTRVLMTLGNDLVYLEQDASDLSGSSLMDPNAFNERVFSRIMLSMLHDVFCEPDHP